MVVVVSVAVVEATATDSDADVDCVVVAEVAFGLTCPVTNTNLYYSCR